MGKSREQEIDAVERPVELLDDGVGIFCGQVRVNRAELPSRLALAEQLHRRELRMRGDKPQQLAADIARSAKDRSPNHGGGLFTHLHIYASMCIIMRMAELKERRQHAIADLIRTQPLASQEELAERLSAQGFAVTQATISRDLEQIGAVKVRRDGQLTYALAGEVRDAPP